MASKKHSQLRRKRARHVDFDRIAIEDGRYMPEALYFVQEALDYKLRQVGEVRHLSGGELLDGIRELALECFGLMARVVFEQWGVSRTEDFGEIVFLLIEREQLFRDEGDSKDDFKGVYDFRDALDNSYRVPGRFSARALVVGDSA